MEVDVSEPYVSDETLAALREIPTQTAIDAMYKMGWPMGFVEGAEPLSLGQKMAGRAITLRFVPTRPDLQADKPKDELSPEYVAIEMCGPGEVLVIDAMRWRYSSVGGDIKFFRLKQLAAAGIVTDGGVRDSVSLKEYGFPVYAASKTAKQGGAEFLPWQVNGAIQCGGALVRPGDAVIGDDDGVVVIPARIADEVAARAREHMDVEDFVKARLDSERCSPGRYYPFNERAWDLYESETGRKRLP